MVTSLRAGRREVNVLPGPAAGSVGSNPFLVAGVAAGVLGRVLFASMGGGGLCFGNGGAAGFLGRGELQGERNSTAAHRGRLRRTNPRRVNGRGERSVRRIPARKCNRQMITA